MTIEEHVPLAPLTTFNIGGMARFFVRAQSVEDIREAYAFAKEKGLKVFLLGGGSNVLIDDAGFNGLVLRVQLMGVEEDGTTLIAAAGESWDALVERAVTKQLWGIENLSGVPGTVGGAVVQNIGAYGQALSQTLVWVEVFDTHSGTVERLQKEELKFGYRGSLFKQEPGRYVVLKAACMLSPTAAPNTTYRDLYARFADTKPTLSDLRQAVLDIRRGKFPDLTQEGTAGSFFKNPIVSEAEARALRAQYPDIPLFAMPETTGMKVPLAWLLDHALHMHGTHVGGARLFERQPLVIAAQKNSSSADVKKLAALVQTTVHDTLHINIEPEVTII